MATPTDHPADVVLYIGERLREEGRPPLAGLPVDLKPLLEAAEPGDPRGRVLQIIDSCEKQYGMIERTGGKGYNYALTPYGADRYEEMCRAKAEEASLRRPWVRGAKRLDRWWSWQRQLFPALSPAIERIIVFVFGFLLGFVARYILGVQP